MSQIAKYLRLQIPGDKEAKLTTVTVTGTPTIYTTALTSEQPRKHLYAYNNTGASSGECYYGYEDTMTIYEKSQPIPKGSQVHINVASTVDVYFMCVSGEYGDLRVEEIA